MNAKAAERFHVYSVVNDSVVLARDLQSSPEIANGSVPLSVFWNERSASEAYARAIVGASVDFLVFAHQDIYLPGGWFDRLARHLDRLDQIDANWAVAGSFGVKHDANYVGHLWDAGLGCLFGGPFLEPIRVASLDEVVLIVRRSSGLSFDPQMPSFHLYGTDIVLTSETCGRSAYVIDLPVIHNTKAPRRFHKDYTVAYRYMTKKWRHQLPWPTVIVSLTTNPLPLLRRRLRTRYNRHFHPEMFFSQLRDPRTKARELGFELEQSC